MNRLYPETTGRRVLFCIYSHNVWGGIEHWLTGLARYLQNEGWDVSVGLARGRQFNDPDAFRKIHPDLRTQEFDGRTGTGEGRIRAVTRVIAALRPDVVIPVGMADVFHAAARVKESGLPLRVLAPLRATSPELMGDMAMFAPVIDLCVGNNPIHAAFLRGRRIFSDDRLRTIINGVAVPDTNMPRAAFERPVPRLLFVGRLHPHGKRVLDLPALVEELDHRNVRYHLTIVGDGEGKKELLSRLGDRIEHGIVSYLGYLPPDRIAREIYPQSDLLLHFSAGHGEGCPQVLQQAMAHAVVPICSEFLGIHSLGFLRDGETCHIFPEGDVIRAAGQVESLVRAPDLVASMGRAGKQAMREFEMGHVLNMWEAAIGDVSALPSRNLGAKVRELTAIVPGSSRLDRLGLSPAMSDSLRRTFRRYPRFSDGWAEWPGTLAILDERTRAKILDELGELDESAREMRTPAISNA